ncbi:MAG: MarR family winged helix-turn-helix transcriptional regulator [Rhodospirillales bacterium]
MPKTASSDLLAETQDCACLNLRGAARAVTQMYDQVLKPCCLKGTQFSLLAAVATEGPASLTTIAEVLVMDRTTLTRNLKPLLSRHLIKSNKGHDKRQRTISLTPEGEKILAKALPLWKKAHERIVSSIGLARWRGVELLLNEAIRFSR